MFGKPKLTEQTEHEKFRRAQQEWDYRLDKNLRLLSTWRALALIAMTTLFFVIFWAGSYLQKPKLVPYVVELKGGEISFKGVMQASPLTVTDAVVRNYIIRFVSHLRSVSSDPVVLRDNLLDLYSIATLSAQRQVTAFIAKTNPFGLSAKGATTDLRFTLFQKIDQHTWRAEWVEETRDQGELKSSTPWAGTFSYAQRMPTSDQEAEKNPFGLYFTSYFITKIRSGQ